MKHQYDLPNTETEVIVKLTVTIDGFDNMAVYMDTFTIFPRPTAAFTDDGHLFSSCSEPEDGSDSRKIRFANQSQGNIEQLIWNFGDGNELKGNIDDSLLTNLTHAYPNVAGKYDVFLVAIDSNQCVDSLIKDKHVTILGIKGDFTYLDTMGYNPLTVTFTPLLNADNSDYSFYPDSVVFDAGNGSRVTTSSPFFHSKNIRYTKGGSYLPSCFMYKTIYLNREDELCVIEIKGKDSIRVVELIADFEILEYYLLDSPVVFTNTSIIKPANMPYDLLIWNFSNGDVFYDFDGKTTFNKAGEYIVKLQMKVAQYTSEKRKIVKVIKKSDLPVSDITNNNSSVLVYPNPASTQLHIEHSFEENTIYSIYNILGQNILQGILQEEISTINIESLTKGVYYLKISGKENAVVKFVKD